MNPPSIILGGGVHGKTCWLIAYNGLEIIYECSVCKRYVSIINQYLNQMKDCSRASVPEYGKYHILIKAYQYNPN